MFISSLFIVNKHHDLVNKHHDLVNPPLNLVNLHLHLVNMNLSLVNPAPDLVNLRLKFIYQQLNLGGSPSSSQFLCLPCCWWSEGGRLQRRHYARQNVGNGGGIHDWGRRPAAEETEKLLLNGWTATGRIGRGTCRGDEGQREYAHAVGHRRRWRCA